MSVSVREAFLRQAAACSDLGSPFMASLLRRAVDEMSRGGPFARLAAEWEGRPAADAHALRFAAALHALVLTGRAPALEALYPGRSPAADMDRIWPEVEAVLAAEAGWIARFIASPPQTNETARAFGIACGAFAAAAGHCGPVHLRELGASAGLNLHWDRFAFQHPAWRREDAPGPVIPAQVTGEPPAWRDLHIASRRGCDQSPLDPSNEGDRLRLRAYVWPDQPARLARLDAALDLAAAASERVEQADAADWLEGLLKPGPPEGLTIVYHSIFLQYPPPDTRERIRRALHLAGEQADDRHRLARVAFEPAGLLAAPVEGFVISVETWPGAGAGVLATVDPHGRWLNWLRESV